MTFDDAEELRQQLGIPRELSTSSLANVTETESVVASAHSLVASLRTLTHLGPSVSLVDVLRKDLAELQLFDLAIARKGLLEELSATHRMLDVGRMRLTLVDDGVLETARRVTSEFAAQDWTARAKDIAGAFALSNAAFRSVAGLESVAAVTRPKGFMAVHELAGARTLGAELGSVARFLDAAQFSLGTLADARVGELVSADIDLSKRLGRATFALGQRHAEFMASLGRAVTGLSAVPQFAVELPPVNLFVHSEAVRGMTPHSAYADEEDSSVQSLRATVTEETQEFLESALVRLKPSFVEQYRGAKARVHHKGPDWWSQGASSMRKLFKGVLHTAAPNDLVEPWAKRHGKPVDPHGRPTRPTKIAWLCEFVDNDEYRLLVQADVTSALTCLGILDTSQHVDEYPEFEAEYNWILLRVEVAIRHILKIWTARSE
jgi:hypothetical protein